MTIANTYESLKQKVEKTTLISDWIEDHIWIMHPLHGQQKFELKDYQVDVLLNLELSKYNIMVKARQLGFTSLMLARSIHQSIYESNYITFFMVNSSSFDSICSNLRWIISKSVSKNDIVSMTKNEIRFSSGSMIRIGRPDLTSMKSWHIDHLILDECCFYNNLNSIVRHGITQSNRVTMYSSPSTDSKKNKVFQKRYTDKNTWNSHMYTWVVNSGWDDDWKNSQIQMLGNDKFDIEMNCKFI